MAATKGTTRLSSKGQLILPASIRAAQQWQAGLEFNVEVTADGVLLRPIKPFPVTSLAMVAGCVGYTGSAHAVEAMDQAITDELQTRHDRG